MEIAPDRSPYEQTISTSFRRISRSLDQYSHLLTREYGLTSPQLVCLRYLSLAGEVNSSNLAKAVALSQPTVTGILDRLEARGLVTRTRNSEDRRAIILRATPEGTKLASNAPSSLPQMFSQNLSRSHPGEQALIDWVLQRVADMMGEPMAEPAEMDDSQEQ